MKKKYIIIGIVLILLIAVSGYVYFFVYNKQHPDFEELQPDHKIEASLLYTQFKDDPAGSQQKYTGKMVQISGTPSRIETVDSLTIAVFAFEEGMFGDEGVRCTFLSTHAPSGDITSLEGYEIKGFCSGYNDTDVILEKCSLVKIK